MTDNDEGASIKVGDDPANGNFSVYAPALLALEDNRNLDADLAALEKYSNAAANTNEQVVYGEIKRMKNLKSVGSKNVNGFDPGVGNANLIWENGTNDETHGEISKIFDETNGIKKNPAGTDDTDNNQSKNRREFGEGADGNNGKNAAASSIFTKTNIDSFRLTTEFDGESDPQNCRGFQPGDLTTANNFHLGINDINISATGGNTFRYPVKQADGTWGVSTDHYEENEATKRCTVGLLEKYYIALKANAAINYANSEDNQKIVDASYNIMLQIAQLVDENPTDQA
ncbi:31259_t:CDS:2, partial [Racocetra persica]